MLFVELCATLVPFARYASALRPHQPLATHVNQPLPMNGWTPRPTSRPKILPDLIRKQDDPGLCGYLEGDLEYPLYCDPGWACMYDNVYSWFGCCTGTAITDCDVYTACVNSRSMDDCLSNSECYHNPLITGCGENYAPFCATLYSIIEGSTYGHYGCANKETSYQVMFTSSKENESSLELETETGLASFTGISLSKPSVATITVVANSSVIQEESSRTEAAKTTTSNNQSGTVTMRAPTFVQSGAPQVTVSLGGAERVSSGISEIIGGVLRLIALLV